MAITQIKKKKKLETDKYIVMNRTCIVSAVIEISTKSYRSPGSAWWWERKVGEGFLEEESIGS